VTDRAVFLVDRDGVIRYVRVYDIPQDIDVEELMAEVEKLATRRAERGGGAPASDEPGSGAEPR
jgi:alkyl hydroperoxide reductase subunit AhpC